MKYFLYFLYLIVIISLYQCKCEHNPPPIKNIIKTNIDEKEQIPEIKINRYEIDLFNIDINNIENELQKIKPKYKNIFLPDTIDKQTCFQLKQYLSDKNIQKLYKDAMSINKNLDEQEKLFSQSLYRYKKIFPEKRVPKIYSMLSGVNPNSQVVIGGDSIIIFAVDMFLGRDFYTKGFGIPLYMTQNYTPQSIVPSSLYYFLLAQYPGPESNTFIDKIIHQGKILYLLDLLLPDIDDTLKIGYTKRQLKWCEANEKNMWTYIIDQKVLFSTDQMEYNKFILPAPFTYYFGKNSPGRTGVWIGWQIVRRYMLNNPNTSITQLMIKPAKEILNNSSYKPA